MSFYEYYFDMCDTGTTEVAVCCPFEHTTASGVIYKEHNPSAHVNLDKGLFHCMACDTGHNEVSFIKAILNCSMKDALLLQRIFKDTQDIDEWKEQVGIQKDVHPLAHSYNISDKVIEDLNLLSRTTIDITFPVFMYNHLIDTRMYVPNGTPKVKSRLGAPSGLILPYDLWRATRKDRITLICAGEKDMAVARSHGFNAITITGGENALPITTTAFIGRKIVIVYDHDEAGTHGANKLANFLLPYAKSIKVCTTFHETCKENKEDITDFFNKYNKTRQDLINYIEDTPEYTYVEDKTLSNFPLVSLHTATNPQHIGKLLKTNIQVVAMSESTYAVPTTILGEKLNSNDNDTAATMLPGVIKSWELTENTIQDILHLIDDNFTEEEINKHIRKILKIPEKERYIVLKKCEKSPVFKCNVTDLFETTDTDVIQMEYTAYSVGFKLESGKKYLITYKLVPHPYKGQQLIMLITSATDANDSVTNFKVTDITKEHLKVFQNISGTVEERMNFLAEKVKHYIGYDGINQLIQTIDLSYHTVLRFNFGNFKNERGYLDTFIVSESRIGKSSTANALRNLYKLGVFTSLAGASATIPGLIGGSNKQNGTFQTRAGLIPQNHLGLIIFEEFGKSANNVITELTDIRSSNEVRITRVSGTLTLPALVRMITLTNVKTFEGVIKPIATYPNGIAVITELIGAAEDIARYDMILVLGMRGAKNIDPLWKPMEPYPEEIYETRVRWVWSRTADQVILTDAITHYIIDKANELNTKYDSHIKIFGTEAWKKITRLAISIAGYLVSTDKTYENIIVCKEHVDYAINFLINMYDNHTFRLKEYVENEHRFSTIDEEGIQNLQDLFFANPTLLLHLEQSAKTSKSTLQAATGLSNDDYNKLMNRLVTGAFVQFTKYDIIPTERFRLGMYRINRHTRAQRLGEVDA